VNFRTIKEKSDLIRCLIHETARVFNDRLLEEKDIEISTKYIKETLYEIWKDKDYNGNDVVLKDLRNLDIDDLFYCEFMETDIEKRKYEEVKELSKIKQALND